MLTHVVVEVFNSTLVLTLLGALSSSSDSVGAVNSARGEAKGPGRRVSAPPVVTGHGQQRALLREKSKENQLDRNGCQQQDRDSDKGCFDVGQYHTVVVCYVCSLCLFVSSALQCGLAFKNHCVSVCAGVVSLLVLYAP